MFISKQAKVAPQRAELGGNGVLAPVRPVKQASKQASISFVVTLFLILSCALPARADIVTGLVGWWKLDGGTSGNIANNTTAGLTDSSGRGNNCTAINANSTGMAWVPGRLSGAVSFDEVTDYVDCGSQSSIRLTTTGSVAMWFKLNAAFSGNTGTQKHLMGGGPSAFYFSASTSHIYYYLSGVIIYTRSNSVSWDTNWHHVIVTADGTSVKMYIDSVVQGAVGVMSGDNFFLNNSSLKISRGVSTGLSGIIDDVRIYNRALSAADVLELYNNGGPTTIRNAVIRNAVIR